MLQKTNLLISKGEMDPNYISIMNFLNSVKLTLAGPPSKDIPYVEVYVYILQHIFSFLSKLGSCHGLITHILCNVTHLSKHSYIINISKIL